MIITYCDGFRYAGILRLTVLFVNYAKQKFFVLLIINTSLVPSFVERHAVEKSWFTLSRRTCDLRTFFLVHDSSEADDRAITYRGVTKTTINLVLRFMNWFVRKETACNRTSKVLMSNSNRKGVLFTIDDRQLNLNQDWPTKFCLVSWLLSGSKRQSTFW